MRAIRGSCSIQEYERHIKGLPLSLRIGIGDFVQEFVVRQWNLTAQLVFNDYGQYVRRKS